jgi:hypothetical protein
VLSRRARGEQNLVLTYVEIFPHVLSAS